MPLLGDAENQRSVDDGGSPNVGRGGDGGSPNVGRCVDIIDPPNVGLDGVVLEEEDNSPGGVVGVSLNVSRGGSLNCEEEHGGIPNICQLANDNNDDASHNVETDVAGMSFSYIIY